MTTPVYPVYIPSLGRPDSATPRYLAAGNVPYRVVVEPHEEEIYAQVHGANRVLVLPFRDRGIAAARNWIKDHAESEGHRRHWQIDDNIRGVISRRRGRRLKCRPGPTLRVIEGFVDRYSNVAIAGLKHHLYGWADTEPFTVNQQVYSCVLVRSELGIRWRHGVMEDTDFSLQVLAAGWCTVLFGAFQIEKAASGGAGGNTETNYLKVGRYTMARNLQRRWPGITIRIARRHGRAGQTVIGVFNRLPQRLTPASKAETVTVSEKELFES